MTDMMRRLQQELIRLKTQLDIDLQARDEAIERIKATRKKLAAVAKALGPERPSPIGPSRPKTGVEPDPG